MKQEEENFALFNYVNELNNECELLKDQVKELSINMNEQREINRLKAMEQQDTLVSLNEELRDKQNQTNTMKNKLDTTNRVTSDILDKINSVFVNMKQSQESQQTASVLNLLGGESVNIINVNKYNVNLFLAIIEKTIVHLINIVHAPLEDNRQDENVHFEFDRKGLSQR
uniref:Outer dynein arm protein 1 n=1 Tax=Cacopsylla melanoneura TaxID=428564 RepID=A0A8D8VKM2_9HEMI